MPTCVYCGKSLLRGGRGVHTADDHTIDHVYPRSMVNESGKTANWRRLNRAPSCPECNSMKGRLDPLDWLVIMPNNHNAARLAERLIEMGEDMNEVFSALRRRKR